MKRIIGILFCIFLVLSLCSCGPSDPAPSPSPDPEPEKDLAEQLFDALKGVWVRNDSSYTSFLIISRSEGKVCYTAGVPMSDYVFGGPVDEVTKTDNVFYFTVHVPERPSNELSEGWAAHDLTVKADISKLSEQILIANDHAFDGQSAEFTLFSEDTENYSFDALYAGNENMTGPDTALLDSLYNQISGIWLYRSGVDNFFVQFGISEGQHCVTEGIPASGFVMGGPVTFAEKAADNYDLVVFVPGRHDMESDYDDMYFDTTLTINSDGTITYNLFADTDERVVFSYECADWDSFDWDSYYDSLGG